VAIGIIGACDGPTSIYVTSKYAPHLLGAVSVAAYCYMSLVRFSNPDHAGAHLEERAADRYEYEKRPSPKPRKSSSHRGHGDYRSDRAHGHAAMGTLMLEICSGERGGERLVKARKTRSQHRHLLLGISIGPPWPARLPPAQTLMILGLGLVAISWIPRGIFLAKIMNWLSGGKVNP